MAVQVTLKSMLKIVETSASALISSSNNSQTWTGGDVELTYDADSTPDAEDCAVCVITLSSGTATIDLTALTHQGGGTKTASGKKVRAWLFKNVGANLMTITKGASNGYSPVGTTFTKVLAPTAGASIDDFSDGALTVDGTNKTLDVSGTAAQQLYFKVVWG
jgi:hypothetical protein